MRHLTLALSCCALLFTVSCSDCHDADLKANFSGVQCPQDCPGVCGCDGTYYCNGCLAAKDGVPVDYDAVCN